ncbi:cytochrome P450 [Obba rivulosa]|uniref:Cytochrome P450 n=1 Tax=Obba rivulosa TaxID=1052685 RepID=A0A8E2DJA6_9APHY|nr:cytochrome P450 [Obba rivulosa]
MNIPHLTVLDGLGIIAVLWILSRIAENVRRRFHTTPLKGPPNPSLIWGVSHLVSHSRETGGIYEEWAGLYGPVFRVAAPLGSSRLVVTDPKAAAHVFSQDTWNYTHTMASKAAIKNILGKGLLWSDGERHRMQRKALTPGFSNAAIRRLTAVYYDSAYKVKTSWDSQIESGSGDGAIIDVEDWMNHVSLDTIGIAGFSHDFGTLLGKHAPVADAFDLLGHVKPSFSVIAILALGTVLPFMMNIPTERNVLLHHLNKSMEEIAGELLENTRKEAEGAASKVDNSIIGLLIKAEKMEGGMQMTHDEVMAQMKLLILAGYETTSISLTWALIELCRTPDVQKKVREELSQYSGTDPTWDELTHGLPYLDGIVQEVLRLHPPVAESSRVATVDDVIPLTAPIETSKGTYVERLYVARGETVAVPITLMNCSTAMWGPDAKQFKPERWINESGLPKRAQEIQGHRHLLTFLDGPRMCLGRAFALAEFKAVLSVLVRNYEFELVDGADSKFTLSRGLVPRPVLDGQEGGLVPMRVRRVD